MDFRSRLREQIEFSGLLDKEVAEKAGITKRAIDSYVGSRGCMPAADVAVRIAKVLGVSVEYLVTGTDVVQESDAQSKYLRSFIHYFSVMSERDKRILLTMAESMSKTT